MRLAILALLGGCSFMVMDAPPQNAQPTDECTDNLGAPAVDTIAALGIGALALAMVTAGPRNPNDPTIFEIAAPGLAIPAVIYGISAVHGYRLASRCRKLHAQR